MAKKNKEKKCPSIWKLEDLLTVTASLSTEINQRWVPMRPMRGIGVKDRIKAAWLVFTGKADAVIWPEGQ